MRAVAVGALDHQVVRVRCGLGVPGQDGVEAAHVAAEQHPHALAVLADGHFGRGCAEQVPGVTVAEREDVIDRLLLAERNRADELHRLLHVALVEERQRRLVLGEALPVQVLGVFQLQVRRVEQQDLRELPRRRRAEDRSAEAELHEPRHPPDVVEVGVGEDDRVHLAGRELGLGPVAQPQ